VSGLPISVIYCSWSPYKKEEWSCIKDVFQLDEKPGYRLGQLFNLEFRKVPTTEPLLCDLESMVRFKVESAYRSVRVPCIVEHAGLVLEGYEMKSFPGGLTQPMWDALDAARFVASCSTLSTRAIARAVIGYCDGMNIKTFVGARTQSAMEPTTPSTAHRGAPAWFTGSVLRSASWRRTEVCEPCRYGLVHEVALGFLSPLPCVDGTGGLMPISASAFTA
jgi:hypothetical protein